MEILFISIGIVLGGIGVWLWSSLRFKGVLLNKLRESEIKANTSETLVAALNKQLEQKEVELKTTRQGLEEKLEQTRIQLKIEGQQKVELTTKYEEIQKALGLFEQMKGELTITFQALSQKALSDNSSEFIKIAESKLKEQSVEGKKELDSKKQLIDQNLEAISKTIVEVQKKIEDADMRSGKEFIEISTLLKFSKETTDKLQGTTEKLQQVLASSKQRGRWGEKIAEDIINLIGMKEGINYIKQTTIIGSLNRPDFTFILPNNLKVNMDAKFTWDNYSKYLESQTEQDRVQYKDELIKNTQAMIKQVVNRNYINEETVDYVILFIPNEGVYNILNEVSPEIIDKSLSQKVILCSTATLYAVLSVIWHAIENFNLQKTTSEIIKYLQEFYKQWDAYKKVFEQMGKRLDDAQKEYNFLLTTRSNMLEKPLHKIELLRNQKNISFEDKTNSDEEFLKN